MNFAGTFHRKNNDVKMDKNLNEQVRKLYNALEESSYTVVITGAGISIAAGGVTMNGMMRDFRSSGMFSRDPQKMYDAYNKAFFGSMFGHGPTYAHKALAELEQKGKIQGIITTNGDCLHTMAGSENVAEIQGSYQVNVCTGCGEYTYDYNIWRQGHMPVCEKCGKMIVPFSQYSHIGLYEPDLEKAQEWMKHAELVIIIGATGCYTGTYWSYMKRGTRIIQINPGRTYFDSEAELNIRGEADPVFEELMKLEA